MSGYIIIEADVEAVVRYLKIHRPEKADRGYAIQLLEIMHSAAKKIASKNIELIEELDKALLELEQKELED